MNQSAPSGPAVMPPGSLIPAPVKVVTTPAVVMRPIVLLPALVNHRAPSGPLVIPAGASIPFGPSDTKAVTWGVVAAAKCAATAADPSAEG